MEELAFSDLPGSAQEILGAMKREVVEVARQNYMTLCATSFDIH